MPLKKGHVTAPINDFDHDKACRGLFLTLQHPLLVNTMCQSQPIETIPYRGYNIKVMHDDDCSNPREDYCLGKMICFHGRYILGDSHDLRSKDFDSWDEIMVHLVKNCGAVVILPLYLYDHSGLALSTRSWLGRAHHAEWDSGKVGFIYATRKDIFEAFGGKRLTAKLRDRVEKSLNGEVETYSSWLGGEVYGFKIEPGTEDLPEIEMDSVWGFIGDYEDSGLVEDAKMEIDAVLGETS